MVPFSVVEQNTGQKPAGGPPKKKTNFSPPPPLPHDPPRLGSPPFSGPPLCPPKFPEKGISAFHCPGYLVHVILCSFFFFAPPPLPPVPRGFEKKGPRPLSGPTPISPPNWPVFPGVEGPPARKKTPHQICPPLRFFSALGGPPQICPPPPRTEGGPLPPAGNGKGWSEHNTGPPSPPKNQRVFQSPPAQPPPARAPQNSLSPPPPLALLLH